MSCGLVKANCLVGEKDVSEMARANVTIIVLSRGPGSRGRDGNSIDGSYGETTEEGYRGFEGEEITDVRFKEDAGEADGNHFVILGHGTPRVIVHLNHRLASANRIIRIGEDGNTRWNSASHSALTNLKRTRPTSSDHPCMPF
jgi:hypothetical protein